MTTTLDDDVSVVVVMLMLARPLLLAFPLPEMALSHIGSCQDSASLASRMEEDAYLSIRCRDEFHNFPTHFHIFSIFPQSFVLKLRSFRSRRTKENTIRGPQMGGQIRRGRIWRFWGAPIFSPEVP